MKSLVRIAPSLLLAAAFMITGCSPVRGSLESRTAFPHTAILLGPVRTIGGKSGTLPSSAQLALVDWVEETSRNKFASTYYRGPNGEEERTAALQLPGPAQQDKPRLKVPHIVWVRSMGCSGVLIVFFTGEFQRGVRCNADLVLPDGADPPAVPAPSSQF